MRFILEHSSQHQFWENEPTVIEINSLEELLDFKKKCGYDIVITEQFESETEFIHPLRKEIKYIIEVYDDYRE